MSENTTTNTDEFEAEFEAPSLDLSEVFDRIKEMDDEERVLLANIAAVNLNELFNHGPFALLNNANVVWALITVIGQSTGTVVAAGGAFEGENEHPIESGPAHDAMVALSEALGVGITTAPADEED